MTRTDLPLDRSETMRRVHSQDTTPELRLREALSALSLRYRLQRETLPGKPDIVFPSAKLAVFVDGDYWHGGQWRRRGLTCLEDQFLMAERQDYWVRKIGRNAARDRAATARLLGLGWRVLRLWESDVEADAAACARQVQAALDDAEADVRPWGALARREVAEFFAGIGLVRLALDRAGWRVRFANDIDEGKQRIYERHFGGAGGDLFVREDVHRLPADRVPTVALATASFPCTDLSLAGERRGLRGDQSGAFWGFARVLGEMGERRPPLILIENVPGFLTSRRGECFREAVRALNKLGYWLDVFQIDARHFTPQSRARLFLFGMLEPDIPGSSLTEAAEARHPARPPKLIATLAGIEGARWRLAPLPPLPERTGDLAAILEDLPADSPAWFDDERMARLCEQMNDRHARRAEALRAGRAVRCATSFRRTRAGRPQIELRDDGMAGCLRTASGGSSREILLLGGRGRLRARLLTPREAARLQGVPDDFDLSGLRGNRALFAFGDAVCAPVIEWIARRVIDPAADALLRGRLLRPVG